MKKSDLVQQATEMGIPVRSRDTISDFEEKIRARRMELRIANPNPDFLRQMQNRLARSARFDRKGRQNKALKIRMKIRAAVMKHVGKAGYQAWLDQHIKFPIPLEQGVPAAA